MKFKDPTIRDFMKMGINPKESLDFIPDNNWDKIIKFLNFLRVDGDPIDYDTKYNNIKEALEMIFK